MARTPPWCVEPGKENAQPRGVGRGIVVARVGIEPPTRGFSVRKTGVWQSHASKPSRTTSDDQKGGALQARVDAVGAVALYYRCKVDGQEARVRIGAFDPSSPPRALGLSKAGGLSLAGARAKAVELALQHHGNRESGGLAAQRRELAAQRKQRKALAESMLAQTVDALFTAYTDLLKQREKVDARDAELTLKRFLAANEDLATKPAHAATAVDFVTGLRKLHVSAP